MNKKEFEEKYCVDKIYDDNYGPEPVFQKDVEYSEVWQWIEEAIKQARIDENMKFKKAIIDFMQGLVKKN